MQPTTDLLTEEEMQAGIPRRRVLLPWWVKIFVWIFLVFGAIIPVALVFAILGSGFQISLYGLETETPFSVTGILLLAIFLLKGVAAFGLWTEKDWAINLGIIDAGLGIAICLYVMLIAPFFSPVFTLNLRLELALLIPYLVWLNKTRTAWTSGAAA